MRREAHRETQRKPRQVGAVAKPYFVPYSRNVAQIAHAKVGLFLGPVETWVF